VEKYDELFMAMCGDDVGGWRKKSMMRDMCLRWKTRALRDEFLCRMHQVVIKHSVNKLQIIVLRVYIQACCCGEVDKTHCHGESSHFVLSLCTVAHSIHAAQVQQKAHMGHCQHMPNNCKQTGRLGDQPIVAVQGPEVTGARTCRCHKCACWPVGTHCTASTSRDGIFTRHCASNSEEPL
jgi:hypothetical protein